MPQTIYFIQDKVTSLELVHSLDLPATVCKEKTFCILLDEYFLAGFLLQSFNIFVINNGKLKALNLLELFCLFLSHLVQIDSTNLPMKLDFFTSVHPIDLKLQKVWLGWK